MTLPSRHRIRNSKLGGLRPSTLPLGHEGTPQYWIFTNERGRTWSSEWGSNPRSPTFQAGKNEMIRALGHFCAHLYRLNWGRRTSWRWGEDTALQTQGSKFKPWRSEAEHANSRSRRLPTILTSGWGRNIFVSFKPPRSGNEPRTLA